MGLLKGSKHLIYCLIVLPLLLKYWMNAEYLFSISDPKQLPAAYGINLDIRLVGLVHR